MSLSSIRLHFEIVTVFRDLVVTKTGVTDKGVLNRSDWADLFNMVETNIS